jgi:hypothetical protein
MEKTSLERIYSPEGRELLKGKFVDAFKDELRILSLDYKDVLVDDLVTAFQNRINVLMNIQSKHVDKS